MWWWGHVFRKESHFLHMDFFRLVLIFLSKLEVTVLTFPIFRMGKNIKIFEFLTLYRHSHMQEWIIWERNSGNLILVTFMCRLLKALSLYFIIYKMRQWISKEIVHYGFNPVTVALQVGAYLILLSEWDRCICFLHFTGKETKAPRGLTVTFQGHMANV